MLVKAGFKRHVVWKMSLYECFFLFFAAKSRNELIVMPQRELTPHLPDRCWFQPLRTCLVLIPLSKKTSWKVPLSITIIAGSCKQRDLAGLQGNIETMWMLIYGTFENIKNKNKPQTTRWTTLMFLDVFRWENSQMFSHWALIMTHSKMFRFSVFVCVSQVKWP